MTPILKGTASRLGLRKPEPAPPTETLRRAQRRLVKTDVVASSADPAPRLVNLYQWRAFENGLPLEWLTTDEDLIVYSKPSHSGATLVDQCGQTLMGLWRW